MSEILANLKNIYREQKPRFWNLKSDFFPIEKVFRRFSKILQIYSILNLFLKKHPKNQRTFFFPKYSRFWNLKSDFFPIEKLLNKTIFLANFIFSELIISEVSKDLRNIFFPKVPPILELKVGFFSVKKSFSQMF